ncbi:phage tail protein [Companilactobacillus musae]|uniref:phage tail-collar fiber domain-containing protein n=1 Tax=Companilactobacillus musae TaxID=1903258 RepID=UPI000E6477DB|nr:phage tail protein [Companilactobacillus musae]
MSKYNETILTSVGLDLATRAANGKTKFTITKATATADDLTAMSEAELQNLTVLPNEIQTGSITNQTENIPNSKSVVGTEILFTNQGIDKGYLVNAVGLYAKEDGKDEEILYALNTAVEPEFMPDFADQVLLQFRITMYVIVGRTENVTVTIDPSGMASKDYVNTKIAEIDVNDKIQDEGIAKKLQNKLVYTDNKSQDKNAITQVAEALGSAVYGFKTIDKDGNVTSILPDADSLVTLPGEWNNNTGGSTDPDHPAAGVDIYPGSLANGEITERNLEWSGTDDPTKDLTVTFKDDPGSNPFGQYSGLTILGHIQKTVMTSGTKGAVSNLELNYDLNNVAKNGYFTTTSPYPIYISQSDIASGQELDIPINGVGEGLDGSNTKPAIIHLKYNADKTMTISHEDGYVNDGNSAGATGANYSFVVELIATFSTQKAVAQLPSSINLFTGSASGNIVLSGLSNYFENSMDGIQISLANDTDGVSNQRLILNSAPTIKIPKEDLVLGNSFDGSKDLQNLINRKVSFQDNPSPNYWEMGTGSYTIQKVNSTIIKLAKGILNISITLTAKNSISSKVVEFPLSVIRISTYKN